MSTHAPWSSDHSIPENGPPNDRQRLEPPKLASTVASSSDSSSPSDGEAHLIEDDGQKRPKSNIARLAATFWCFALVGANDATYGAMVPHLQAYYHLSHMDVSTVFTAHFVCYLITATLNHQLHWAFGQRGIAFLGPLCHILAFTAASLHQSFLVFIVVAGLGGAASGLIDSAWNAWIGGLANADVWLGALHAFYGVGAAVAPICVSATTSAAKLHWWSWYYFMLSFAVCELLISVLSFWHFTPTYYRRTLHPSDSDQRPAPLYEAALTQPYAYVTWIAAFFSLAYLGIEVTLGGWIVTYMLDIRHSSEYMSDLTATGFWLGLTVGRLVLGFTTPKIGRRRAILLYLSLSIAADWTFWLVPQCYVSSSAVALEGFFLGPMLPAGIVTFTTLMPVCLHTAGVGIGGAVGAVGGAVFPFAVGALASRFTVGAMNPCITVLLGSMILLWLLLPQRPLA